MTRLLDVVREWPHNDNIALPPTHCQDCGCQLHAVVTTAGYDAYGGGAIRRILLSCPKSHKLNQWLIPTRHAARYGLKP